MDKYEYNLKLDQMKSLYAEEKYEDAADIADTINWNKIKNVNALVKAGEIYEKTERYEDSRDVLLMAYDRSPIGRMIIYRLAEVAVKMADFEAAQDYYEEFVQIAPHDSLKWSLRGACVGAEDAVSAVNQDAGREVSFFPSGKRFKGWHDAHQCGGDAARRRVCA